MMREYERVCRCCSWRYPSDPDMTAEQEPYCGPCSRTRGLSPDVPHARVIDADWRAASGHRCRLLWTLEEQALAERALASERRSRWPDVQREDYEDRVR